MRRDTDARNPKLFKVEGLAVSADITLRDVFAAFVMTGIVSRYGYDLGEQVYEAKIAYRYADSLLKQREREPET